MHILALDQGTTSSRAIVFDLSGTPRGIAQREFEQIYPRPGWVEHDPLAIWSSQIVAVPTQDPLEQVSVVVHASPSSQLPAAFG